MQATRTTPRLDVDEPAGNFFFVSYALPCRPGPRRLFGHPETAQCARCVEASTKSLSAAKPMSPKSSAEQPDRILNRRRDCAAESPSGNHGINDLTGWQQHSVRGFLAGHVRKRLGLTLESEKSDGERHYRIVARKSPGSGAEDVDRHAA
jgi:hypothetical protein